MILYSILHSRIFWKQKEVRHPPDMSKALNKLRTQTQVCILAYHDLSHIIAAWLQRPAPNAPSSHWKTGEDMLTLKKESKIRAHDHLHFSAINPRLDKLRLDLIPIAIRVLKVRSKALEPSEG